MRYHPIMSASPSGTELLMLLGLSLALGLLIGVERGWAERRAPEGGRIAGIRTLGLLGLLGGLSAILGQTFGPLALGFSFVAVSVVLVTAHAQAMREQGDLGITTEVAGLITFALGAVAVSGEPVLASAGRWSPPLCSASSPCCMAGCAAWSRPTSTPASSCC